MHKILVGNFGIPEEDIKVLIDTDERYPKPEAAVIFEALKDLIFQSTPGDVLFFHYSGHGVRLPIAKGANDTTGYDECIVPIDMNLITGKFFHIFVLTRHLRERVCVCVRGGGG